ALLVLAAEADRDDVLRPVVGAAVIEARLRAEEADVHAAREHRADGGVIQIEDTGVVLQLGGQELAPDGGAVVAALRALLRAYRIRQAGIEARVLPGAHEPRTAEVGPVGRDQHAAGPQVEGGARLELRDQVEDRRADAGHTRAVAARHAARRDAALEVRLP